MVRNVDIIINIYKKVKNKSMFQLSDDVWLEKKKLQIPFQLPAKCASMKGRFQFRPPKSVQVVGSYLLGTSIKPDLHVDLALTIPKVYTNIS